RGVAVETPTPNTQSPSPGRRRREMGGVYCRPKEGAMAVAHGALTAQRVVDELRANAVTHVIWLVDTESRFMYDALTADPSLTVVPICREGEAMGVALGLQIGGKKPIVVIQNTGFFESGDSIRGLVLDLEMPLVMMVGYRGFHRGQPI